MPRSNIYTRASNYVLPHLSGQNIEGLDLETCKAIQRAYANGANDTHLAGLTRESQLLARIAEDMQYLVNRVDKQLKLKLEGTR